MLAGSIAMVAQQLFLFMEMPKIGGWLFQEILEQLGITEDQFNELK